jgi:hypothetical protein
MCFFTLNDLKDTSGTSRENLGKQVRGKCSFVVILANGTYIKLITIPKFYVALIFNCVGIHGSGNTNGRREIVVGELLRNLKFTKFARFWQSSLYAH